MWQTYDHVFLDGKNKFCVWLVSETNNFIPISLLQKLKMITAPNLHKILLDKEGKGPGHEGKGQIEEGKGQDDDEGKMLLSGLLDNPMDKLLMHGKGRMKCI